MNETQAVAVQASKPGGGALASSSERWLFVDGASDFGGHEVMLLRWLEELTLQRSVEAILLARAGSRLSQEAHRHALVLDLPAQKSGIAARALGALKDTAALVRAASMSRPSVCIVVEGCLLAQPLFALIARCLGLRVLLYVPMLQTSVSMGFGRGWLRDALVRGGYRWVPHGWITITHEQAQDFRSWARVKQPILVLQNTVSRAIEACATQASERPTLAGRRLRVVVLGRLEAHQKGLDTLLGFAAAHPELGARFELSFVGTGPFAATISAHLREDAALSGWVNLRTWSPTVEVMRDADVVLMTSRYEGVPLVMLEAMTLGVPVVAPDFAGTRAFLTHECLFPPGNVQAAFDAVERMRDPAENARTVERNRAAFRAQASNESFAAAVRSLTPKVRALAHARRGTA